MRDSRYYARMYVDKTSDYVSDCVGYVWQCVCQVQEYWSYMSEYIHVIDVSDYVAVVPWIHWRHMTHMTCRVSPCIIDCMSDVSSKYQDGDHLTQSNFAKRNPTHFGVLRFEKNMLMWYQTVFCTGLWYGIERVRALCTAASPNYKAFQI